MLTRRAALVGAAFASLAMTAPVRAEEGPDPTAHAPAQVDQTLGLPRLKAKLVAPPAVMEHEQVATGGPKVIEAIESELDLPRDALELTWRSLADVGNLSSVSVLHVLRDTLVKRSPVAGTPGLLMAMGPGFCSELVLLRW